MHKVNQYFIKQPRFYTLLGDIRTAHHIDILISGCCKGNRV
jgi:hypothetical protein